MANDPERDLLPVKDGMLYERHRNVSTFSLNSERDKLQSPYISKLDRKELEDRYMRLVVDNNHLKRECNKQEEKIKRLATKLLRLVAEQKRDLPTAAQRHDHGLESLVEEQQQQIRELQQSNGQLQDRLMVLRNQLVEHTYMHSAVHCNWMRKSQSSSRSCTRSHTGTYMQSSRLQNAVSSNEPQNMFQPNSQSNILDHRNKDPRQPLGTEMVEDHQGLNDEQRPPEVPNNNAAVAPQNQKLSEETMRLHEQISILEQDLETQREQSSARITELEDELANTVAQNQQQKVAENVEMIRLQRSLQQQSAHLAAQSAKNQVLEREVAHLRQELETKQQDSDELHHQLMNECRKVVDLQQELQGVASNCLSVRELQEQIRDIQNERSTLKEHNERLLALMSSRQIQGSEQEVALRSQVAQLEAALSTELKEKSSLLETQNEMHQKMPEPQLSSDTENALHIQVTQLETKLAKEMSDRAQILESLEEERTQVAALKVSHSDLLVKFQDLQAQHAKIESQLRTVQQDPRRHVSFHTPPRGSSVLPSHSLLRVPTIEQSQHAQTLHERLTSKPGKSFFALSSSASFAEDFNISANRMNCEKCQGLESADASESIPDISSDSRTSQLLCSESKLSATSITDTESKNSAKASNQEQSLQREAVNCHRVSSQSLSSCHACENLVYITDKEEYPSLLTTDEILMTNTEDTFISKSDHSALQHDSQLQKNEEEKSVCEEGSKINDDLSRLKILEHDSWQNDELDTMDSHPGDDQPMTANQLDEHCELEKCRELLRVQYNLNSMYKKEVAGLAQQLNQNEDDHAKKIDEMSNLLQKYTAHITELQSRLKTSEIHHTAHDTGQLTIGVGEGLFEIHIQCLKLSPEGLGSLMDEPFGAVYKDKEPTSLFLTWEFYDQDVAYTPVKAAETCIEFDSSSVHRVTVNDRFLQYLKEESCTVDVHMAVDDASETVATGSLHFSDLLRFPQKKFHSTVPLAGTRSCDTVYEFGILECWFILSCSISLIDSFIQHRTTKKVTRAKVPVPAPRQKKGQTSTGMSRLVSSITPHNSITEDQVQPEENIHVRVNIKEVFTKDKLGEGTAEDIPEGEKGPVEGNPEGSCTEDIPPDSIQVDRETSDSRKSRQDHIAVTINSLSLIEDSSVMKDPDITQLYVEYQFLGFHGQDLETPTAVMKPCSPENHLLYNFRKLFYVDKEEHAVQRNKLRAMLKPASDHRNILRFVIVSEPLEEESSIKDCKEVGCAELNLIHALADCDENIYKTGLPVHSTTDEEIGLLFVTLEGINLMKGISFESEL
ncbi:hypothetical protein B7P43_G00421 [Cryptotermes secundus]|uniref:RPGRIP1 C-terminal domain-containing protein n=1 Tax=Cryptotermes secundus TaxID=105785 RepID=A0A2J7R8X4_9NEOP|nr:X-linked retinitis pigmentosa GTPase regulator-interacting protein 1 isoform X2 [Cryptotermes secundus]PNF37287.1 hypothetical protein B7P43_G00421 [Cryptotermes secundus]